VSDALKLLLRSFPERPAFDTAVSRALLHAVAEGRAGESLRLHDPGEVVAFSVLDRTAPGFPAAVHAAGRQGFGAILRLAGGRAAVYHRGTLAFAWCVPARDPRVGIRARFEETAEIVAEALCALGVDARVGAVPGEYCPGDYSVNAAGRRKLMGVGQRVVQGAAHVGGVLVLDEAERVRDVLIPVYEALGLAFDPSSVGSLAEEIGPIPRRQVLDALVAAFARRRTLADQEISAELLERAEQLEPEHRIPVPPEAEA
jgi:octanoyl-[GcvH]:protein N-octanoyltransferase